MTRYPSGLVSFGVPVVPRVFETRVWGNHWFVDGNEGNDRKNGKEPGKAFLTMEQAFAVVRSGDTIHLRGNVREQHDTPAGVFDVHIVGPSPVTRHPDSNTASETYGGQRTARWNAPATPTASTPLLNVRHQGWIIGPGILFTGDEDDSVGCIQAYRDGGSGNAERDASHMIVTGCRFQGGLYGIRDSGGCARLKITDNEFMLFSESDNDAIKNVTGAGIGTMWRWDVMGNVFHANHTDIQAALTNARIMYNHFLPTSLGVTNVVTVDTTGGATNLISKNWMYRASNASGVNAGFVIGSGDHYGPNYWTDKEEYAEPAE